MSTKSYWRQPARATIERVYNEGVTLGLAGDALKQHVNAAYPFGERAYHPYKIWLDEMKRKFSTIVPTKTTNSAELEKLRAWNRGEPIR